MNANTTSVPSPATAGSEWRLRAQGEIVRAGDQKRLFGFRSNIKGVDPGGWEDVQGWDIDKVLANPRMQVRTKGPAEKPPSVADASTPPKPLMCRIVEIVKELDASAAKFRAEGNDEALCCTWAAAERIREECMSFLSELQAWKLTQADALNAELSRKAE